MFCLVEIMNIMTFTCKTATLSLSFYITLKITTLFSQSHNFFYGRHTAVLLVEMLTVDWKRKRLLGIIIIIRDSLFKDYMRATVVFYIREVRTSYPRKTETRGDELHISHSPPRSSWCSLCKEQKKRVKEKLKPRLLLHLHTPEQSWCKMGVVVRL